MLYQVISSQLYYIVQIYLNLLNISRAKEVLLFKLSVIDDYIPIISFVYGNLGRQHSLVNLMCLENSKLLMFDREMTTSRGFINTNRIKSCSLPLEQTVVTAYMTGPLCRDAQS